MVNHILKCLINYTCNNMQRSRCCCGWRRRGFPIVADLPSCLRLKEIIICQMDSYLGELLKLKIIQKLLFMHHAVAQEDQNHVTTTPILFQIPVAGFSPDSDARFIISKRALFIYSKIQQGILVAIYVTYISHLLNILKQSLKAD